MESRNTNNPQTRDGPYLTLLLQRRLAAVPSRHGRAPRRLDVAAKRRQQLAIRRQRGGVRQQRGQVEARKRDRLRLELKGARQRERERRPQPPLLLRGLEGGVAAAITTAQCGEAPP